MAPFDVSKGGIAQSQEASEVHVTLVLPASSSTTVTSMGSP